MIDKIWHWLTTSRYTRELERQIAKLEDDNATLKRDVDALMYQLYPNLAVARKNAENPEAGKFPKSFNFKVR